MAATEPKAKVNTARAKITVFKELVEHHIQEEEGPIFKIAEKVLDDDEFQKIMSMFEQEKLKRQKSLK